MTAIFRAFRYIWALFCEDQARIAMDRFKALRLTATTPSPHEVRTFERRTEDAWQRFQKWERRAEKNFSKVGVKR